LSKAQVNQSWLLQTSLAPELKSYELKLFQRNFLGKSGPKNPLNSNIRQYKSEFKEDRA